MIKFSIIIPTYNRADFITFAIESVLAQTYTNYELIIVDDGSIDNTKNVVAPFLSDKIHYYHIKNSERGAARNYGISLAKGEIITFFDSDDCIKPNYLEEANSFFLKEKKADFVQFAYEMKSPNGHVISVSNKQFNNPNEALIHGNFMSCIGVFVKKHLLNDVRFCELRSVAGSEDWLLWLQLAARNPLFQSEKVTSYMINHDERSVLQFNERRFLDQRNEVMSVLSEDQVFIQKFGIHSLKVIDARFFSYIALHAIMGGEKKIGRRYLKLAISLNFNEFFDRRFFACVKKLIFN